MVAKVLLFVNISKFPGFWNPSFRIIYAMSNDCRRYTQLYLVALAFP